jgi:hypothetical protein
MTQRSLSLILILTYAEHPMMTAVTGGLAKAVTTASTVLTHSLGMEQATWSAMLLMNALLD